MRLLYWDAFAGISGDMSLGSLLALGVDPNELRNQLNSLGLSEFDLEITSKNIEGINATDMNVIVKGEDHPHRHLSDIEEIISKGALSIRTKDQAIKIFRSLAEAEAHVHGTTIDHIHFHEVGAIDSIVDIVGTAIALDLLDIEQIFISDLPWSRGFVNCAHGMLPLPAPATLELLQGFQMQDSNINGELITPTGAAIVKALAVQAPLPNMKLLKVGYGAGKNYYGIPNFLRAVIGEN